MPSFVALFGRDPDAVCDAPGRVNLIGEHTDYNGGLVLPMAIPRRTRVEAAARNDRTVRLWSAQYPSAESERYELGAELKTGRWTDFVKGMTRALAPHGLTHGFDARVDSAIPPGSGVSSSAALEVALGRALRQIHGLPLTDIEIALAGQRAENEFVGAPVGVMDQLAASLGDTGAALLIDTVSLRCERVPLPRGAGLVVVDSGVPHRHADGAYATRRAECSAAARALGVERLCQLGLDALPRLESLPDPLRRRARHVLTENGRVTQTVAALRCGDLGGAGDLLYASHASLRDDFQVSLPAIDRLVERARSIAGVYGARLTGGGFGGAIVALVRAELASAAAAGIAGGSQSGPERPRVLVPSTPISHDPTVD